MFWGQPHELEGTRRAHALSNKKDFKIKRSPVWSVPACDGSRPPPLVHTPLVHTNYATTKGSPKIIKQIRSLKKRRRARGDRRRCMCAEEEHSKYIKETESGGIRMDMCARKKDGCVLLCSVKLISRCLHLHRGQRESDGESVRASERARKRV